GMPGSISPITGVVKNANSTWLIGGPLRQDLETKLGRPVRLANDANCFTLSEATDGAAAAMETVFGVILGTGVGGGIVIGGRLVAGGGDAGCGATLGRYADRLARGLAAVINLIDPDAIVLGGGVSGIAMLYQQIPVLWSRYILSDHVVTRLLPPVHGDSSGVRGAASLWRPGEEW